MVKNLLINVGLNIGVLLCVYGLIKTWQAQLFTYTLVIGFVCGMLIYVKVLFAKHIRSNMENKEN